MPRGVSKYPDTVLLEALARHAQGMPGREIAERVSAQMGRTVTRNALVSVIHRINKQTDDSEAWP